MLVTYSAGAASFTKFAEKGDFLRLMKTDFPVDIFFYRDGAEVERAEGVGGGYSERFAEYFTEFQIYSAVAQDIQFVAREGNVVGYDQPPEGLVRVSNVNGGFVQQTKTNLTNVAQTVLPQNLLRRYLLIQNNDAGLSLRVKLDGAAATAADGVLLTPGGALELANFVPTGAVSLICTTAGTLADVQIVEG